MKLYVKQIRPYNADYWNHCFQSIPIDGYNRWYPEEKEEELREELKDHINLEFEIRYVEPLPPRCGKCVYKNHCPGRGADYNHICHNYKRDAPDGGYYG